MSSEIPISRLPKFHEVDIWFFAVENNRQIQKEKIMKHLLFLVVFATMFVSALAFGDKKMNKIHKGMEKDGKKINCVYCHKDTNIPKEGTDFNKHMKNPSCAGENCHK